MRTQRAKTQESKPEARVTKRFVLDRVKGLSLIPKRSMVCALVGHSRIVTLCFGYVSCGRCDAQIGDTLGGSYSLVRDVIVGHDCPTCRRNAKKLTWRDTLLASDAFPKTGAV